TGNRAEQCQNKLAAAGLTHTVVMNGGMNAWEAQEAPRVRGRKRWALEREVRLVAGGLALPPAPDSLVWRTAPVPAGAVAAGPVPDCPTTSRATRSTSKTPWHGSAVPADDHQPLNGPVCRFVEEETPHRP